MIEAVKLYRTSDGKTFDDRVEAERHEAICRVEAWLDAHVDGPATDLASELVTAIAADPDSARAVLAPLMPVKRSRGPDKQRRTRRPKAPPAAAIPATVEQYENLLDGEMA